MFRSLAIVAILFAAPALAEESVALKPGPGMDDTMVSCGICHTQNYIKMNSVFLTADAWKAEVAKMRTAFGAPIDDDTAAIIVTYLSSHYAVPPKP